MLSYSLLLHLNAFRPAIFTVKYEELYRRYSIRRNFFDRNFRVAQRSITPAAFQAHVEQHRLTLVEQQARPENPESLVRCARARARALTACLYDKYTFHYNNYDWHPLHAWRLRR